MLELSKNMTNKSAINQEPVFRKDFPNSLSDQKFHRILKDENNVGLVLFYREHLVGRYFTKDEFVLEDIYNYNQALKIKYPNNNFINEKIRQQMQFLRDNGYIEFIGKGHYKIKSEVL